MSAIQFSITNLIRSVFPVLINKLSIIILVFITASFPVEIQFRGHVPSGINSDPLEKEYKRIGALLQMPESGDSAAVIITFYKKVQYPALGIRIPEWGGGGALGKDSIFIPVDIDYVFFKSDYRRILTHELVHIIIARIYGNIRIPRWFHEGMAMALSGEIDADAQVVLSKAVLSGKLLSLNSIENMNRFKKERAHLAYCQSHFAVLFLLQQYGQDLLPELLSEIKIRSSFESACIHVFGLTIEEIDSAVSKEIRSRYHLSFLFDDSLFWVLILILAVIGFIVTLMRKRGRMEQLEQSELMGENIESEGNNRKEIL